MPKRPAKPEGVKAKPRFLSRKPKSNIDAAISRLRKLTNKGRLELVFHEIEKYQRHVEFEISDRGRAILAAVQLERSLDDAIVSVLSVHQGEVDALFRSSGPLGTFSNKVTIAYALDLFGDSTKSNLDLIRNIRNTFAHGSDIIDFSTDEIKQACDLLNFSKLKLYSNDEMTSKEKLNQMNPKERYIEMCSLIGWSLLMFSINIDSVASSTSEDDQSAFLARLSMREPLP